MFEQKTDEDRKSANFFEAIDQKSNRLLSLSLLDWAFFV